MTAANAGQALATVLVDELVRCGVRHACISPGSRSTPLALAMAGHPTLALHVFVDERSSAFCALGIAKGSGAPAAVLCTSGTAAANFLPAVVEADESRTPLLVLTADRPPELRHTGANQTVDQIKLYGDRVRWFVEVGVAEARADSVAYWRSTACRAWAGAVGSPAGPVHLNLAFRDPLVPVPDEHGFAHPLDGRSGGGPWTRTSRAPRGLGPGDVESLAGTIAGTRRGLVIAGDGPAPHDTTDTTDTTAGAAAAPARLAEAAARLAEAAGWPLLADPLSGARCQGSVSTAEALLRDPAFAAAMAPDLVVRIGGLGTSKGLPALLRPGVRQVLVDPDAAWVDPQRAADWLIQADPATAAAQLAREVGLGGPAAESEWLATWHTAERIARTAIDDTLDGHQEATEPRCARDVAAACPDGSTLVVASSMPVRDLEWFMAPRGGLRVLANRGASGIDGFVSTALGAAWSSGGPTVALAGDLSMLHDQNGLLATRGQPADVVFVVINNDGGGIFSFLPQAHAARAPGPFERLFGTPHGVSFEALAAVHGCQYRRVDRAAALGPALLDALDHGGVRLIEVPTNREANTQVHHELWATVSAAIRDAGLVP